jgi:4-diphosphocytidyl-2-C-methyl-D-erythritol kinase
MHSLTVTAPAKVNLCLGVGAIRADGFHSVETILHTLRLADTLTLTPADDLRVTCDRDLGIPARSNLAYKAAEAFSAGFDVDVLLDIHIEKRIPSGAGLGGGSSDAAAVLAGLAHWAGLPRDDGRLVAIAAGLGADVPFFLQGGAALMAGRGDELVRHLIPLAVDVVLLKPSASVPTAEAYRAFDGAPEPAPSCEPVVDALARQDSRALAESLSNNMTAASQTLVPEIADALGFLGEQSGVFGRAMAGSGSAVFGLCDSTTTAETIAARAAERGWWSAATRTSANGPMITQGEEVA